MEERCCPPGQLVAGVADLLAGYGRQPIIKEMQS